MERSCREKARMRGSITIYLLLSLLLITGLVFTLTESARIRCIQTRLKSLMFLAADSCFAGFSREIFEEYGIMALWKNEAAFTADFSSYLEHNLGISDLGVYRDVDLILARPGACAISGVQWLTDDQGNAFLDQVCEYMEYYLVKEGLEELLGMLGVFDESEKIGRFVEKINSYKDIFLKVADAIASIQHHVDQARSVVNNPKTLLGNMNRSMQRYAQTGNNIYIAQFNTNYWNLGSGRDEMLWHMQVILDNSREYERYALQASDAVESLRDELEKDKAGYSEETLQAVTDQLDALAQKSADPEGEYYRITENAEAAQRYEWDLESLDNLFYNMAPEDMYEHMLEFEPMVSYYDGIFQDFNLDELGLANTGNRVQRESAGFLSTVRDIFTKGLLEAVAGKNISDRKADTAQFPSKTARGGVYDGESSGGYSAAPYKRLILAEYIAGHFGNFKEPKDDTELSYEMEYMLAGKASDKENLKTAMRDLVMLRSGLNMVSLMRDPGKMREAELMALAIIGFTGIAPLIETVKMLIISIWCLAESLCDVKALAAGSKVPVIKESWQWTVSAAGLKNFSKSVVPAISDEQGMDYTGYLKVMLLGKSTSVLAFRAMDMIQANACRRYEPSFRMKECINRVRLTAVFDAKALFSSFLFVKNIAGIGAGIYGFTVQQQYGYT